jgi:hypothetical protein
VGDVNVSEDTFQWLSLFWFFGVENGKHKTGREDTRQAKEQHKRRDKRRREGEKQAVFLKTKTSTRYTAVDLKIKISVCVRSRGSNNYKGFDR